MPPLRYELVHEPVAVPTEPRVQRAEIPVGRKKRTKAQEILDKMETERDMYVQARCVPALKILLLLIPVVGNILSRRLPALIPAMVLRGSMVRRATYTTTFKVPQLVLAGSLGPLRLSRPQNLVKRR